MSELNTSTGARQHLYILRRHALGPLSTAEMLTEKERDEVVTERDAFQEFANRVAKLSAVTADRREIPLGNPTNETANQRTAELRQAYEETVMSVPHYDDAYGETLEENVIVEFGAEIAEVFRVDSSVSFSPRHKKLLADVAEKRVRDRDDFCDRLASEIASVQSTHAELSALLDTLDNSVVPAWHSQEFLDRLDAIQESRQSTLFSRSLPSGYSGHTLCGYLYADEPWTYPGLTAVARVIDSVVIPEDT